MPLADLLGEPAIYFVRHGETELNAGNKFRGLIDVELDDNGIKQAKDAAKYLESVPFVAAHSGHLSRHVKTAKMIAKPHGDINVQHNPAMAPWNIGQLAGKPKNDMNRAALQHYADNPDEVVPGGESLAEFKKRYRAAFDERIKEAMDKGGPVLLVGSASNAHEIGDIINGDIDSLAIKPGGCIVVYITREGLKGRITRGAEDNGTESQGVS